MAKARHELKLICDNIDSYIALYGDEDGTLKALRDEASAITSADAAIRLIERINSCFCTVETAYTQAKQNLETMIAAAETFYNRWKDNKENIEQLATAIQKAQEVYNANTTESSRNIAKLQKAYTDLDTVYAEMGGHSDPYVSRENLKKKIAEAEIIFSKYLYRDLSIAINEAKANQNSNTKYVLDQQINNLDNAIKTTLEQYQITVKKLDTQLANAQLKLKERYGEDAPEDAKQLVANVKDSLSVGEQADERVCTNIQLLQDYSLKLQQLIADADQAWEDAVNKFFANIQEAELRFNSNYPDNEQLKQAIQTAKSEYERIATDYKTIVSVEILISELDAALAQVEGNDRLNIANMFVSLYTDLKKKFDIYGSDENTVNTSNAKLFLEKRQNVFNELKGIEATAIHYSISELEALVNEATEVASAYQFFWKSAEKLTKNIAMATTEKTKYYQEDTNNPLAIAIEYAKEMLQLSLNLDSIEKADFALKDSLAVTERAFRYALSDMKSAITTAKRMHNTYYGQNTTESEILTKCAEAQVLTTDYYYIPGLKDMKAQLDACYKSAQATCAEKEEAIKPLIAKAEVLCKLMPDNELDETIATSINACYSTDGRILAIDNAMTTLSALYDAKAVLYKDA